MQGNRLLGNETNHRKILVLGLLIPPRDEEFSECLTRLLLSIQIAERMGMGSLSQCVSVGRS